MCVVTVGCKNDDERDLFAAVSKFIKQTPKSLSRKVCSLGGHICNTSLATISGIPDLPLSHLITVDLPFVEVLRKTVTLYNTGALISIHSYLTNAQIILN